MQPAIALQEELVAKIGVTKQEYELDLPDQTIQDEVAKYLENKLGEDLHKPYPERNELIGVLRTEVLDHFAEKLGEDFDKSVYNDAFDMAVHKDVRKGDYREGPAPRWPQINRNSSAFQRGWFLATSPRLQPVYARRYPGHEHRYLGANQLRPAGRHHGKNTERRYMHHYNAPGWTVGEVRRLGSPGRREIGHGYLAERALTAVLPTEAEFPYTIRSVTEIMSQNGSTSIWPPPVVAAWRLWMPACRLKAPSLV